jgi:formylglycine-generating enzyme required for sulfatase activity
MHDWCPETVLVPAGSFLMGSPDDENGRLIVEGPQRVVVVDKPLAVGKYAVTVDQFAAFAAESDHPSAARCRQWDGGTWQEKPGSFRSTGFTQAGNHPAVCVSWNDAQAYAAWLSMKSGKHYRLLTEAEWEYAARAGTVTPFSWGASIAPDQANYNATTAYGPDGISGPWRQQTLPVESFAPNPWGLHQVHGNVWEWVEDCWCRDFHGAPSNTSARQSETTSQQRVLRGGSWLNGPRGLRSARRHAATTEFRRSDVGFRIARLL